MPVWHDGILYVPYTVFDDNSNGVANWMRLGVYGVYSSGNQTVSLYNLSKMMVFDLEENTCYDQLSGRTYPTPAILRNGLPFVPVGQVCSYFGFTYSYLTGLKQGIIVRIKSNGIWASDASFIDSAPEAMDALLREYNQGQSAPPSDSPSETPGDEPPAVIPLYLGVRCQGGGYAANLADMLDAESIQGLFFFSPDQLRVEDDLVRRLIATGHSVGLLLDGEDLDASREQLEQGRTLLREAACIRPSALLCPEEQRQELEAEGWTCWRETASIRPDVSSQEQARILRSQEEVRLTLDDSAEASGAAGSLIYQLKNQQFNSRIPMETRL